MSFSFIANISNRINCNLLSFLFLFPFFMRHHMSVFLKWRPPPPRSVCTMTRFWRQQQLQQIQIIACRYVRSVVLQYSVNYTVIIWSNAIGYVLRDFGQGMLYSGWICSWNNRHISKVLSIISESVLLKSSSPLNWWAAEHGLFE